MSRDRWTIVIEPLPCDVPAVNRVRSALKILLRRFGLRCVALQESEEVRRLQGIIDGLAARLAAQSELLARAAERRRDGA